MMTEREKTPLITIGITCYNAAGTIERAIRSALAQDWPNTEIIVVDDCSADSSAAIVEALQGKAPSLRLIRHEKNTGVGGARNSILAAAHGEFIAFFDDDDESAPERLSVQYRQIRDYESRTGAALVACYASGQRIYQSGYILRLDAIGSRPSIPQGSSVADYLLFYRKRKGDFYGSGTPTCALMARRTVYDAAGGFDPAFRRVEDVDFAVRLALAGCHFIGCPERIFTQYATSGSDKSHGKNLEAELKLAEKHQPYLRSQGFYLYARLWPKLRFYHFNRNYACMAGTLLLLTLRYPFKTVSHFFQTGPRRLLHEKKMKGPAKP